MARRLLLSQDTVARLRLWITPGAVWDPHDDGIVDDEQLMRLEAWRRPDESDDAVMNRVLDAAADSKLLQFPCGSA